MTLAIAIDPSDPRHPNWAEVRINFQSVDGQVSGAYDARIDAIGIVETMKASGKDELLCQVKQYRVSQLTKLPTSNKYSA